MSAKYKECSYSGAPVTPANQWSPNAPALTNPLLKYYAFSNVSEHKKLWIIKNQNK